MSATVAGRIGPNAVTRVAAALAARPGGAALARRVFERAGEAQHLDSPPTAMVDEAEVCRLHQALRLELGEAEAARVAHDAGLRAATYLLAHRIPRSAQRLLRALPPWLAAALLLRLIRRHAWTFVGSGRFDWERGAQPVLRIADNPLCRGQRTEGPACHFYAGTFQGLFAQLVHPGCRVVEIECQAQGAAACRLRLSWPAGR